MVIMCQGSEEDAPHREKDSRWGGDASNALFECLQCVACIPSVGLMQSFPDLHVLEHFVVLARTKNFTRAAEELHLSQSALSRSIQKLEEQVGQTLCERKPREVVLTEMGKVLLDRGREILKLVEATRQELSEAGRRVRVRLGAIPTIAPYFLPHLLGGFSKKHPEICVVVEEDTTDVLVKRCEQGEIDLTVLALPINSSAVKVEPLFDEELLLVVPQGHALADEKAVTSRVVKGFPFVMLNEAHCLSENIASFCRRQSIQPVSVERTSQLATVQELVALDHGVSLVPEMARRLDASDRRVYCSFAGEKPFRTVALMWNPKNHVSRAVKHLMDYAKEVATGRSGGPIPKNKSARAENTSGVWWVG